MLPPSIVYTVEPTITPVTLEEVKAHLRVDHTDQDSLIQGYIFAATKYAQEYTWSQLITSTFVQRMDRFPGGWGYPFQGNPIGLLANPVVSVASIQYVDSGGTTQTQPAANYTVDIYTKPARIIPAYASWWPTTRGYINDVIITFDAGYGASETSMPVETRQAILLLVEQFYSPCGDGTAMEKAIKALLDLRSFRTFY